MNNASASKKKEMKSSGTVTTVDSMEAFLESRGISLQTAQNYGLHESGGSLVIPYRKNGEVLNNKYRGLAEKRFWQDGGQQFLWNIDCLTAEPASDPTIITEGELDALSAIEAGYAKTLSVPNGGSDGTPNTKWLDEAMPHLGAEVILAMDNDNVGHSLLEAISCQLGKARCKWVKYPKGCKDLNEALIKYGPDGVRESIKRARWVDVSGAYKMSELPPLPYREPMSADMGAIDNHIKLRLGDFSVLTGVPGHGKTTFINDLINRVLEKYDLKACFASFENPPQSDHRRALRTWHSGKFEKDLLEHEREAADAWIDKRYMFIVPDERDSVTLEWLMDRMELVVLRHGVRIIVIDPWNEMDHRRPSDCTMTEYVAKAIMLLKGFAKSRGVHVMVVAHPAKLRRNGKGEYPIPSLYDISDSQHWANKADLGIVVHRGEEGDTVRNVKSRYHTEIGAPGIVDIKFIPQTGRFMVVENDLL